MRNTFSYNKSKRLFNYSGDLKTVCENAKINLKKLEKEFIFETQLFQIFNKRYENFKNNIQKHRDFITCAENELKKQNTEQNV